MTLKANAYVSDNTAPSDLSLPVTLTGVREQSNELQIHMVAEGSVVIIMLHFYLLCIPSVYGVLCCMYILHFHHMHASCM